MDITIPPHNLKRFSASITCLGKIGKDLYLSFDPLDGLTLSSLNDAKSAYGKFHFDSHFFERCSAPTNSGMTAKKNNNSSRGRSGSNDGGDSDDEEFYDTRYVCRVPVRSIHSILRPRKGVCSLRIRSEGMDDKGNYFGLNQKKKKKKKDRGEKERGRHRSRSRDDNDSDNDDEDGGKNKRGSFSARERSRSRSKRRKQMKMKRNNDNADGADDPNSMSQNTSKMMLSFEFFIERPPPRSINNDGNHNPNNHNGMKNGGVFRVLHKVGVTDANGITLSASVTQRRTRSEIVCHPKLWLRLLDPLRRTAEVALTIDDELNVVTATSFHPGEIQQHGNDGGAGGEQNAVLQAAAARNAQLKTETSTGTEEFDEYDFRNQRGKKKQRRRGSDDSDEDGSDGEEDEDFEKESDMPPLDVNQKAILVFSIKEAKVSL